MPASLPASLPRPAPASATPARAVALPPSTRRGAALRLPSAALGAVVPGLLLLAWWLSTDVLKAFTDNQLPPLAQLLAALRELLETGDFTRHVSASLSRVALGFAAGAGVTFPAPSGGAADAPAPGESVLDTSPFGSAGAWLAGLSAAAAGGVGGSGGFWSSTPIPERPSARRSNSRRPG